MNTRWFWIVFFSVLLVIGVTLVILWQTTDLFSSSPSSTGTSEGAETTVRVTSKNLNRLLSRAKVGSEEFNRYCVEAGSIGYLCDMIEESDGTKRPPEIDSTMYKYGGIDTESGKMMVYPWTENVLKLSTVNLTGEFDSLVFTAGEDLWSSGFDMDLASISGDEQSVPTEAQINEAVQAMLTNVRNHSTIVLGDSVLGNTKSNAKYTFDTANGSTYKAQKPIDAQHTLSIGSSNQFGALRIAIRHLEFEFTLNGESKFVRVVTSDPSKGYLIGDKLLKVDGEFQYFDLDTQTFTTKRPARPCTMWSNGRESSENPEDAAFNEADSIMETVFKDITSDAIVPMPIELTSMPDLARLRDNSQSLTFTIDFIATSHVGLRGMHDVSEDAVTDADVIKNFDIDSLGLSASIKIT